MPLSVVVWPGLAANATALIHFTFMKQFLYEIKYYWILYWPLLYRKYLDSNKFGEEVYVTMWSIQNGGLCKQNAENVHHCFQKRKAASCITIRNNDITVKVWFLLKTYCFRRLKSMLTLKSIGLNCLFTNIRWPCLGCSDNWSIIFVECRF